MMKENIIKDKSFKFSLRIIQLYKELQSNKEYVLSKQLLTSGTSIGANVSESEAAITKKDFIHKLSISSKEARESLYWLELLEESQLVALNYSSYIEDVKELIRILTFIIKTSQASLKK